MTKGYAHRNFKIRPYTPDPGDKRRVEMYWPRDQFTCCRPHCGQPAKYVADYESGCDGRWIISEAILCPRHAGLFMARHNVDITPAPEPDDVLDPADPCAPTPESVGFRPGDTQVRPDDPYAPVWLRQDHTQPPF